MSDQTTNPAEANTANPTANEATIAATVQRCLDAYHHDLSITRVPDGSGSAEDYAARAYCNAMPFLSSPVQIDAFIACVAHGILIGVLCEQTASKLLYAAQVAITSRRAQQQSKAGAPEPALSLSKGLSHLETRERSPHKDQASPSQYPPTPSPSPGHPEEPSTKQSEGERDEASAAAFTRQPAPPPSPSNSTRTEDEKRPPRPMTADQQRAKERLEAWMQKHHHPASAQQTPRQSAQSAR